MISRYPHTAVVKIASESNDPIPVITDIEITIPKGRYQPSNGIGGGNNNLDYSAKFFCPLRPELVEDPHLFDGQKMIIHGKTIGISKAWNYQTHCEIWLD